MNTGDLGSTNTNDDSAFNSSTDNSNASSDNSTNSSSNNGNNSENENFNWCGDIPGGFQTIPPIIFNIVGEILGDVVSGRLPFNVQNAVGNWIQLVGQVIETSSSQQQYFQSGPGRCFNPIYLNVTNPFCPNSAEESEENMSNGSNTSSSQSSEGNNTDNNELEIQNLKSVLNEMEKSIDTINKRLAFLENNEEQ